MPTDQNAISAVLHGLLAGQAQDRAKLYQQVKDQPAVQSAREAIAAHDPEDFHTALLLPLEQFIDGMLEAELPGSEDAQFLFSNYRFVEAHIENLIVQLEGRSCCADKARTVIAALAHHFYTQKPIAFDYAGQYTFHLPKKALTTHDDILAMFKALQRLYYGQPRDYIGLLGKLLSSAAAS